MPATTIDEVLLQLQAIIDRSITENSRTGYFAALYYKVTQRVKEGIQNKEFDDNERMERLDVIFASRYLTALEQWERNDKQITASWLTAFKATKQRTHLVLQHLFLGMNAHINLDLGIAAVQACEENLPALHSDFNKINTIIASLTYEVINEINRVSPLLSLLGFHYTNKNSIFIQFSIGNARDGAWVFANDLAGKKDTNFENCIKERDKTIYGLATDIAAPGKMLLITIWIIKLFEMKSPSKIVKILQEAKKRFFSTAQ
jgi:hypothetical protein